MPEETKWAGHVVRLKNSCVPKNVMGGCFRRRRPVRNPRGRWEDAFWRDATDLLQIQNWKAAARNGEGSKKKIEEAMVQKWAKAPLKKKR
jgi:hypothetical protein